MRNHTKIISVFCLILILGSTQAASAVRLVPGNVPQTDPLQPLPEDVQPNYKESIGSNPTFNSSEKPGRDQTPDDQGAEDEDPLETAANPGSAAKKNNEEASKNSIFWIIVIITGALIGGLFGYQEYAKKKR